MAYRDYDTKKTPFVLANNFMMFKSVLIELYTILSSFPTNFTVVWRSFCCVLLQYVLLKIFFGCEIALTLAALHSLLFLVYQSYMSVEFAAFKEAFITMRAVK